MSGPVQWGDRPPSERPPEGSSPTGGAGGRRYSPGLPDPRVAGLATRIGGGSPETVSREVRVLKLPPGEKVSVKDDGDCLCHALQWGLEDHQDYLGTYGLQAGPLNVKTIRAELSSTLKNMIEGDPEGFGIQFLGILMNENEKIQETIDQTMATRDLLSESLSDEGRAEFDHQIAELESRKITDPLDYAAKVATPSFWGGEAELIGFTHRYCLNVKVFKDRTGNQIAAFSPPPDRLAALGIAEAEVPTIYLLAEERHYNYFRPS